MGSIRLKDDGAVLINRKKREKSLWKEDKI